MAKSKVKITDENIEQVVGDIVAEGFAAKKTEDDIKGDLFRAGVSFGKINTLFKASAIAQGLMVDPKVMIQAIDLEIAESDWDSAQEWPTFSKFIDAITESVQGATKGKVLAQVKKYFTENELKLPVEPKEKSSRAKGGKVTSAMVDYMTTTVEPTKSGMYEVVLPLVKGHKNAIDYVAMFFTFGYAVKMSISLDAAHAKTKGQPLPSLVAAETEVDETEVEVDTDETEDSEE